MLNTFKEFRAAIIRFSGIFFYQRITSPLLYFTKLDNLDEKISFLLAFSDLLTSVPAQWSADARFEMLTG
ncbi:MAG TPA: hypothetical protein PK228_12130 [Saprospiraceae bacterium]|nr:hypothetical protein [Saprospiraceae bacterium]